MGTTTLLGIGTRAMFASYAGLHTTGNNISNANTPGYSRQQVELSTSPGQYTGAGFFGRGVNVETVTRSHDQFLTREAILSRSIAAGDESRNAQLELLERIFDTGETGLGHSAGELLNAFVDVANKPQDLSARQVALARADEMVATFRNANEALSHLQTGVTQELTTSVAALNSLAQQVAKVNDQIALARGSTHAPNDLLDQRDALIAQMASYVQITTIPADDGTVGVFMGGGQQLVLGSTATQLGVVADAFDPSIKHVGVGNGATFRALPDDRIGAGSIAGLLRFQADDLVDARNRVGQMASALALRMNEQQSYGLDLRQPAGMGAPIFDVGTPQALAASTNARDGSGNPIASVSVSFAQPPAGNASELQGSDYELRLDPNGAPGAYQLTRLTDGRVWTIADGDTVDGMTIDIGAGAFASGDRFLLRPVAGAITGLRRVLDDPRGIAAATPVTATLGVGNAGTATVASLRVASSSFDPTQRVDIVFTSATGNYTWELRDAATNVLNSTGSGTWTAGQPIVLNGWELKLNGVPGNGDTIAVDNNRFPANSNGNALALVAVRDEKLVGRQLLSGGTVLPGETITDAYASTIADIGVRVQGARSAADISGTVAREAETARAGYAGVNLDEEAARLIQYQQSYQAAAKILQVAQTVFDTLLDAAGR
jgi:flagellar hook-associated protein 1 FlgK